MPDFDTRKPQEPNEPSRHRIASIAGQLRTLLIAYKLPASVVGAAILLLVGMVFTVGLLIHPSGSPGDGRQDSRIAFVLDGNVWTMKADGSDMERLTDTGRGAEAPVWSPGGEKIAVTRMVSEYGEGGHTSATSTAEAKAGPSDKPYLYVMNADGSDQNQLVGSHAQDPAWSPDGEHIAYSAVDQSGGSDIYVTDADGSGMSKRLTTAPAEERFPAWSPDGEYIAFESERVDGREPNNYVDIYVMKACCVEGDNNQPQRLTYNPGWNRYPKWSPDGTEIAFTYIDFRSAQSYGNSVSNTDVHKIDASGSETRLTHTDSERLPEHLAAWSPSGDKIAFVKGYYDLTRSLYSSAIYAMNADGSDPTLIKEFPGKAADYPDWFGLVERTIADESAQKEDSADWQAAGPARQDAVLPAYFEQMDGLLRWKDKPDTDEGRQARKLAREKTLQLLAVSDPSQKRKVVRFLLEADVLRGSNETAPFISLSEANLEGADLSDLDLSGAELEGVKLKEADLGGTDLSDANLGGADLTGSDAKQTVLRGANLYESYLEKAELIGADLSGADLSGAQVKGADLSGANLTNADLTYAELTYAELKGAELEGAKLKAAELEATNIVLPDKYESRVRAWEHEARSFLRKLTAAIDSCVAEYHPPDDTPSGLVREYKVGHCHVRYVDYGSNEEGNITHLMVSQDAGQVLVIKVEHYYGGSAFKSSTATGGRIERIPRF